MALRITCIKKSSGYHDNPYEAIQMLGWTNIATNESGQSTRLEMYDWIQKGETAYVEDFFGNKAYVKTAVSSKGTKYLKTVADETKTDNLLNLPECL